MFFKIGILKSFAIFTGKKPVLEFLFNKVAGFFYRTLQVAASAMLKIRKFPRKTSVVKGS